jgi:hypothetical protein
MSTAMPPSHHPIGARPVRRVKPWHIIGLVVLALVAACLLGTAFVGAVGGLKPSAPAQVQPVATASVPVPSGSVDVPPGPIPGPVNVKGKNNSVVQVGAVLNGRFQVNYSFGYWCGIASFLRADGTEGAGFMQNINDCAGDTNTKLSGSTVVQLQNVTMVKVENTRGAWTLQFVALG